MKKKNFIADNVLQICVRCVSALAWENGANVLLVGAVGLWADSVCFCSFLRRGGNFNNTNYQAVIK